MSNANSGSSAADNGAGGPPDPTTLTPGQATVYDQAHPSGIVPNQNAFNPGATVPSGAATGNKE